MHLTAVHIFPSLIQYPAVRQRPGSILVLTIAGYWVDIVSVSVTAIQHSDLGQPAVYPAITAIGAEYDSVVRQVGRFNIIILTIGKLLQIASVSIDFVEMEVFRAGFAIGEYNLSAVVVYLRVTDSALRVVQLYGNLAGPDVQFA